MIQSFFFFLDQWFCLLEELRSGVPPLVVFCAKMFPCMHDSLVAELSDSLEKMMLFPFLVWRHIVYNYSPKGR